jgi:hypothetical protein
MSEILTTRGWLSVDEVEEGDRALTLNTATGLSEWQPVEAVNRFEVADEPMLSVEGRDHSSLSSLGHRWPTERQRDSAGPRHWLTGWATSEELASIGDRCKVGGHHPFRLLTAAPSADLPTDPKWSDALVELVAWFWTEGTINRRRAVIYQSHSAYPENVARIRAALTALIGPEAESLGAGRTTNPEPAWREYRPPNSTISHFKMNLAASALLLSVAPGKQVADGFILALTAAQLELFIATSIAADGHVKPDGTTIIGQKNSRWLEPVALACILSGRLPQIRRDRTEDRSLLTIKRKVTVGLRNCSLTRTTYTGTIWCPTTANGTWLARRNGTVYYTGNSTSFLANLMSKLRLYAAVQPDPEQAPIAVDSDEANVDATVAKIAMATLARLRSTEGGQSALVREMSLNFEVAAECYLHGHEDADTGDEEWQIRSVDELTVVGDEYIVRDGLGNSQGGTPVPADDVVIRMWERHPRISALATCAMRGVLSECEALLLLSREVRAGAKSRLSSGILLVPSELSFGSADPTRDGGDGEETEDPFSADLAESMITPIQEEGSAAAVVPVVIRGPAEVLKEVRHLILSRPRDPILAAEIDQRILRIARGLNMPVEVTLGMMNTTFANAATIKEEEFDSHIEPRAILVCDALTAGYFQGALIEAGVDPAVARTIFVWFDATALIVHPDQAENAQQAFSDGVISEEARRRYVGYREDDAPDDDEKLLRLMLNSPRMDPFLFSQLLARTGLFPGVLVPAPQSGIVEMPGSNVPPVQGPAMPIPGPGSPPPAPPPAPAAAPTPPAAAAHTAPAGAEIRAGEAPTGLAKAFQAAGVATNVGARLTEIDRQLRHRILIESDVAMRRALERAGAKIRAATHRAKGGEKTLIAALIKDKPNRLVTVTCGPELVAAAGVDDPLAGAFDGLAEDTGAWIDLARSQALTAIEAGLGAPPQTAVDDLMAGAQAATDAAVTNLTDSLTALAGQRLYDPTAGAPGLGEADPSITIPSSLVRESMGIAGGADPQGGNGQPVTDAGGNPLGGVATGEAMMGVVDAAGGGIDGYEWQWGGAERPFEPHQSLDGVTFVNFDDDVLANNEGWPETDFFFPGDHDGCTCDMAPVIIDTNGEPSPVVDENGDLVDQGAAVDEGTSMADTGTASTLDPGALADLLGFAQADGEVTAELEAWAKGEVDAIRSELRDILGGIRDEHTSLLQNAEADKGMVQRPPQSVLVNGEYVRPGGYNADWYDALTDKETSRLTQNWFALAGDSTALSPDEIAASLSRLLGRELTTDEAMQIWLTETRIIDAANTLSNGRAIVDTTRYGGLNVNSLIDSPYDLNSIMANRAEAAAEIARVEATAQADEARMILSAAERGGTPAWEMTEADYVQEVTSLEAEVARFTGESQDEWGPMYRTEEQAAMRRLDQLVPPGIDDPHNPMSADALYRTILRIARQGGLV